MPPPSLLMWEECFCWWSPKGTIKQKRKVQCYKKQMLKCVRNFCYKWLCAHKPQGRRRNDPPLKYQNHLKMVPYKRSHTQESCKGIILKKINLNEIGMQKKVCSKMHWTKGVKLMLPCVIFIQQRDRNETTTKIF